MTTLRLRFLRKSDISKNLRKNFSREKLILVFSSWKVNLSVVIFVVNKIVAENMIFERKVIFWCREFTLSLRNCWNGSLPPDFLNFEAVIFGRNSFRLISSKL